MDVNQSNTPLLNFFDSFLNCIFFGSKGIFYLFSFNYSVFSDTFDIQKLLIDLGVFGVLFYISSIGVNYFTSNKKNKHYNQSLQVTYTAQISVAFASALLFFDHSVHQ